VTEALTIPASEYHAGDEGEPPGYDPEEKRGRWKRVAA
jgi:hypothetical protein